MYEKIKKWYEQCLWTEEMVKQAVKKNVITQDECDEILLLNKAVNVNG